MDKNIGKRDLQGKTVVITGSGDGLGKSTAFIFAHEGVRLVLSGRSVEKLEQTAQKIRALGVQVTFLAGDIRKENFCEALIEFAIERFGRLDILINNAGTIDREPLISVTSDEWKRVMETNLDAVFYLCRAAIPLMPKGSSIINVGSTLSSVGAAHLVSYCASKGAIALFTKALALELAEKEITVNAIAPGSMNTPMLIAELRESETAQIATENNRRSIPQGRIPESEEVARAMLFLAQETHMSGSILSIDGGYTAQ